MRAHGHKDALHREPYLQSELVQRTIKDAVFLRYELIHYLYHFMFSTNIYRYTQFYTASQEGTPIIRPMWYEYPTDTETFDIET